MEVRSHLFSVSEQICKPGSLNSLHACGRDLIIGSLPFPQYPRDGFKPDLGQRYGTYSLSNLQIPSDKVNELATASPGAQRVHG